MSRIAESELIINSRGAIYHLDARPEEIGNNIILVGDPGRVKEVSKHFDSIEFRLQQREFITHTGFIGKKRISVISTGIGPDNIDIVMNEIDALANIDFEKRTIKSNLSSLNIMRFGTSGSLQKDIPMDSFVAGTHGLGFDNVMHFYGVANDEKEQELIESIKEHTGFTAGNVLPYIYKGSKELLKLFVTNYHQGITATSPGFYGPQGRILRLNLAYPELVDKLSTFRSGEYLISNFEMESSVIYGLGKALGHQYISLNVIVANRITKEFSKNGNLAVENLIKQSLGVIADSEL